MGRDCHPVFICGFQRGGTTYVQRIVNCHRDVEVWGENAGLMFHLRALRDEYAVAPTYKIDKKVYNRFTSLAEQFIPWANPVDVEALDGLIARFVESMYWSDQVARFWGFKEVRHCECDDVAFLCRLFPKCRIVLLTRHPEDVVLSRYCVHWSRAQTEVAAVDFVRDVLSEYVQRFDSFVISAERWPANTALVKYESVRCERAVGTLFDELLVPASGIDKGLLAKVLKTVAGSSYGDRGRAVSEQEQSQVRAIYRENADEMFALPAGKNAQTAFANWYPERPER